MVNYSCNKDSEPNQSIPQSPEELKNELEFGFDGIWLENGILSVDNMEIFKQTYSILDEAESEYFDPEPESEELFESDECLPESPILDQFEAIFGFHSIRKKSEEDECFLLNQEVNPEDVFEPLLLDDVLLTFLNHKYQVRIGDKLHMLLNEDIAVEVQTPSYEILLQLEEGANPFEFGDEVVIVPTTGKADCLADFTASVNVSNNSANFNFSGFYMNFNSIITWTFGDGGTGSGFSESHSYQTAGTYNVCVTVEDTAAMCRDEYCEDVQIGEPCNASFSYTEGADGTVTFQDLSDPGSGTIISRQWSFGDGASSTQSNPTHQYDCNLDAYVCLTITTSTGCTDTYCKTITVRSIDCCSAKAKVPWTVEYYNNNNRRIKYKQKQVQWLLSKRVRAKMKNYKQKNNGKWKKYKDNLSIILDGDVYTRDQDNCRCKFPFSINTTAYSSGKKKKLKAVKVIGDKYDSKDDYEWSARYYVGGQQVHDQTTPVNCD